MYILPMDALLASYFLQAALASIFLFAMWGLVSVYGRPLHRAIAIGWTIYLVQMLATMLAAWFGRYRPEASSQWSTATVQLLAVLGSCVWWYVAIRILAGEQKTTVVPRPALIVAVASGATLIGLSLLSGRLLHQPGSGPLKLLYPVPYLLLAWTAWRRASQSAAEHRRLSAWLAFAFLLFAVRILLIQLVVLPEPAYRVGVSLGTLLAVATVQLTQMSAVSVIALTVAFLYERAAGQAQMERLHQAELRLQKSQRLEILGRMAAGIAHDFNNILGSIGMGADLAMLASDEPKVVDSELRRIGDSVERARSLVRRLLPFARATAASDANVEVDAAILASLPMLERLTGDEVVLAFQGAAEGATVAMDATQLEQIVLNLVVNSRDATSAGGSITISTQVEDVAVTRTMHDGALAAGRYVRLAVRDTGSGIPADVLPHVLKPFFTTKPEDRGTGIGLATVQQAVAAANGDIAISSTVGVGTCVDVYLPAAA